MTTLGASLSTAPPTLSLAKAAHLAQHHFGITGELTQLTSERDLNFRLTTATAQYVLKLANPAEPPEVTHFQTAALLHLDRTRLPVPKVIRTLTNETEAATPHGILRLLTYMQGLPQYLSPRTPVQRKNLGTAAAKLSLGLQGFHHPAATHVLQWDIKHAANLRPLLPHVPANIRQLATETLDRFDRDIAPLIPTLRTQVVHNDLNPHNVLVNPANTDEIAAILDFGDMVETPLICDAAVTACYQIDAAQPWQSLLDVAKAYHAILPLTALETRLLPDLVATRMLTSLAIASARVAMHPDNAPYILRNYQGAQDGLIALANLPRILLELS
ncbi:MAG: phosphotransferase [Paracoccaceae bacterium]